MYKNIKKSISLLLSLAVLLTLIPMTALAAGTLAISVDASNYADGVDAGAEISLPVVISENPGIAVTDLQVVFEPTAFEIVSITRGADIAGEYTEGDATSPNCIWVDAGGVDSTATGTLFTVKLKVLDGVAGTYTVTLNDNGTYNANGDTVTPVITEATITVGSSAAPGYTAGVATTGSTVTVGTPVTVNVGVSHSSDTVYNAGEIVLNYNPAYLALDTTSLGSLKYNDANGVLTIEDFGEDKNFSTSNYPVTFNTLQVGTASVTLDSAAFVHKDNADESDLIPATLSPESVEITINEVTYNVTLPDDGKIDGDSVATKGQDYTFTAEDTDNYDYTVTVKVGGNVIDTVTGPDANGEYTIPADSITGDIEISYTREGKPYTVEWTGTGAADVDPKPTTANYGTDFEFSVPTKVEPTAEVAGATYSATVSIEGSTYSYSAGAGETVTIPGTEIVGKITINVTREELPANGVTVSISGEDVKFDDGTTSKVVTTGTKLNLVLTPENGYIYSVTIGDQEIMNNDTTTYELTVQGTTEIKVSKTLDTSSVAVYQYVTMDAVGSAWLVTFNPTLADGKVPTYDGNPMYWSEKYNAYCYLVIADTQENAEADAAAKVNVAAGSKTNVDYGMDINGTNVTDAADAQLVWNMYNAMYNSFDETVNGVAMMKFLAADQNATSGNTGSWKLTVEDAQVIIDNILAGTATT